MPVFAKIVPKTHTEINSKPHKLSIFIQRASIDTIPTHYFGSPKICTYIMMIVWHLKYDTRDNKCAVKKYILLSPFFDYRLYTNAFKRSNKHKKKTQTKNTQHLFPSPRSGAPNSMPRKYTISL